MSDDEEPSGARIIVALLKLAAIVLRLFQSPMMKVLSKVLVRR